MVSDHARKLAIASTVLGIISIVFWFFGLGALVSVVLGIIGLVLANKSKHEGWRGGIRTAGFVTSLVGLIGGGIAVIFYLSLGGFLLSLSML